MLFFAPFTQHSVQNTAALQISPRLLNPPQNHRQPLSKSQKKNLMTWPVSSMVAMALHACKTYITAIAFTVYLIALQNQANVSAEKDLPSLGNHLAEEE